MKSYYRGPIASGITVQYTRPCNDGDALALAAHESAHVVVGHALGCRVNSVAAQGLDGLARMEADGISLHNRLVILACGDTAARKINPNCVSARRDEDDAIALASQHSANPAATLKAAREHAVQLVDQFWPLITRVARELRQNGGFMSGDVLTRMFPVATSYAQPRVRSRAGDLRAI
jgi:hypothetical protein